MHHSREIHNSKTYPYILGEFVSAATTSTLKEDTHRAMYKLSIKHTKLLVSSTIGLLKLTQIM